MQHTTADIKAGQKKKRIAAEAQNVTVRYSEKANEEAVESIRKLLVAQSLTARTDTKS